MHKFYEFNPVDTLYFRGAEPMNMGRDHNSSSIFPPPAHTISGAVRTAYLKQHNIDFSDYGRGNVDEKIIAEIGKAGDPAPFSIIGPLLKKDDDIFIPAPYSWYREKPRSDASARRRDPVKIIKSTRISSPLIKSRKSLQWAKGSGELESIGGSWIKTGDFAQNNDEIRLCSLDEFVDFEIRAGIALDHGKRTVREGHLYSFNHARLNEDVSIVFGIDREISLDDTGILRLGAEQRFGHYKHSDNPLTDSDGGQFLALSAVAGTEDVNNEVVATGKIRYVGGWDMKKRFHKPMRGFYPAGTVYNSNINNNCIAIPGGK